jgi:hypothetical protein
LPPDNDSALVQLAGIDPVLASLNQVTQLIGSGVQQARVRFGLCACATEQEKGNSNGNAPHSISALSTRNPSSVPSAGGTAAVTGPWWWNRGLSSSTRAIQI